MISASKTQLFMHCDYWIGKKYDEAPSDSAMRGTQIHAEIADFIVNRKKSECLAHESIEKAIYDNPVVEKRLSYLPNGIVVDDNIAPSNAAISGQADLVTVQHKTLVIIDWKTGRIPVNPVNNWQLITYAGLWLNYDKCPKKITSVGLLIGKFTEWNEPIIFSMHRMSALDVLEKFELLLTYTKMKNRAPFSGNHCDSLYCPIRKSCDRRI